jgi:hypothetical protein
LDRLTVAGLIVTDTGGTRVIMALADFAELAELVAVTVTFWTALMLDGAVYMPLVETVPIEGLSVQVTAVFVEPATLAVNC